MRTERFTSPSPCSLSLCSPHSAKWQISGSAETQHTLTPAPPGDPRFAAHRPANGLGLRTLLQVHKEQMSVSYAEVPLGWRGRGRHGGIGLLWPVCWSVCRLAKLPRAGPRTGSANRQSGSAALTPGATAHRFPDCPNSRLPHLCEGTATETLSQGAGRDGRGPVKRVRQSPEHRTDCGRVRHVTNHP